ncbi:MAG: hypothetical protein N3B18_13365, partial [Desulfobacterota bacterium]|nr:hypothetical protein [Thermodesulfobacteriota bacterium]
MAPTIKAKTGLSESTRPRFHFDIYAIYEGPQELYFGHDTQVNVNVIETVRIKIKGGREIEKCYMSPTKRRGVERRTLIEFPVAVNNDKHILLGDKLGCGIPHTCCEEHCPICSVFGGLITDSVEVTLLYEKPEKKEGEGKVERKAQTYICLLYTSDAA